jgi:hypothetical protein
VWHLLVAVGGLGGAVAWLASTWQDRLVARRVLAWVLVAPLVGASVLVGHWLAYGLTGRSLGEVHEYLGHAPEVVALVALVGLVGLAVDQRATRLSARPFAGFGVVVFVVQEHAERLAHDGQLPFLLTDRTFLLGLVLQLPVGLAAVLIARRFVADLRVCAAVTGPRLLAVTPVKVEAAGGVLWCVRLPVATLGRGPPPGFCL